MAGERAREGDKGNTTDARQAGVSSPAQNTKQHRVDGTDLLARAKADSSRVETWLKSNRTVREDLKKAGRDKWPLLEAIVQEAGLTDMRGESPSRQTLRRTWRRIEVGESAPMHQPLRLPPTIVRLPTPEPPPAAMTTTSGGTQRNFSTDDFSASDPFARATARRQAADSQSSSPRLPRRGS